MSQLVSTIDGRGQSERAFLTHQGRLPKELALHRITEMEDANQYLRDVYLPNFNAEFMHPSSQEGSAFIPCIAGNLDDILCEQYERTVSPDNCVSFEGKKLQIPRDEYRCNYIRVKVRVHRYTDGSLAVFHGPRKLADYHSNGQLKNKENVKVKMAA